MTDTITTDQILTRLLSRTMTDTQALTWIEAQAVSNALAVLRDVSTRGSRGAQEAATRTLERRYIDSDEMKPT